MPDSKITALPVRYKHRRVIKAREMYASPEPSDLMVWEICPHTKGMHKGVDEGCQHCPRWRWEEAHKTDVKDGCRAWAEEACRIMMAVQRREAMVP